MGIFAEIKCFTIRKPLLHRIMNDKLMEVDRTFLSRSSEAYKHQILGFTSTVEDVPENVDLYQANANNTSLSLQLYFPKLRMALDCGRKQEALAMTMTNPMQSRSAGQISRGNHPRQKDQTWENERVSKSSQSGGGGGSKGRIISSLFPPLLNYKTAATFITDPGACRDWRYVAQQKIASLTRALDATSAVLQSPLLPEESE